MILELKKTQKFSNNHTYIRLNDININGIKLALKKQNHVEVNLDESNEIIELLPQLGISTGLNVVIGKRVFWQNIFIRRNSKSKYRC